MDKNIRKLELTIAALKESLSQKVADYEEYIANIRADATLMLEENNLRIADLERQLGETDVSEES